MITTIIIVGLAFIWLGYESNLLRINLMEGGIMRLPSGTIITEDDLDFLTDLIKPPKVKSNGHDDCWYCGNGHDTQHIEGVHPFDLCECGASIVIWSKRTRKKSPYAKLAGEVNAIMSRNYNPSVARRFKTKAMI